MTATPVPASFRDPSGFVYTAGGEFYRQVNRGYQQQYEWLMASGLYDALVGRSWLVRHEEVPVPRQRNGDAYRVLKPERIPYVSWPYEWCFSQLQDAALLTLDIQMLSLAHGMTLKDASAYNVQFVGRRPVFIDTLSFDLYEDGKPWVAYRQFCQHFLAPLALLSHVDGRLRHLLKAYLDGMPLDLASRLLPARTRLRFGLFAHVHAHARSQQRHQGDALAAVRAKTARLPKARLLALLESLRGTVQRCAPPARATEWGDYYEDTNYSAAALAAKETTVRRLVDAFAPQVGIIHDIGANTGRFSRLLAGPGRYIVSHDIDELAVERHYVHNRTQRVDGVLPLLLDLTNPSPSTGWGLAERDSALDRLEGGTVVALALMHHLAISNNVPLPQIAALFARIAGTLVIEFVPKEDSQVQRLLASREDIFPDYTAAGFEGAFSRYFEILAKESIPGMSRSVFAMRRCA